MDFALSQEEEIFRRNLREFLGRSLRPHVGEIEERGIPRDFVLGASSVGLWAMPVSEDVGGQGASWLETAVAAEEVGRADFTLATAVMFLLEASWGYVLDSRGSDELRGAVLPRVTSGEWFLGVASTEPQGGSDVAAIRTSARRDGDHYSVTGQKMYISGGMEARSWGGGHLLLAKTDASAGHRGISMFYLPASSPGLSMGPIRNMGRSGISTVSMYLDDVAIPAGNLVGRENEGFYYAMDGFNRARVLVSAACLGAADAVLEIGLDHLRNREAFGHRLKDFQSLSFEAADLSTRLEMAKLLTYEAAWAVDRAAEDRSMSDRAITLAAMAKLTGPQVAHDVMKSVIMWMGALGYSRDALVEAGFRGAMSYVASAEGALNVMRLIISKRILG
ncbi:MAG: acyl-CoA dehydrogenase family protein [Conexivisphaera sp.]